MNKNEYKEALNKIVISDELREKIIRNSSEKKTYKYKRNSIYKQFWKVSGIAACFAFCMLSYYAVTNYYHSPDYIPVNTTPPTAHTPDNSNGFNAENNNVASVIPDIDSVKTDNTASVNENNATNVDNFMPTSGANQGAQSNSFNKENIAQDDFPPVLNVATPTDSTSEENTGDNESDEYMVCAVYSGENMSAIAEIEQELGYEIKVPNYIPDGYETDSLSAPFGSFAEITYTSEIDTLYYRTAKGSEDISGDYNDYADIETVTVNNNDVTIKGNDNLYHNASWFSEDEAFSIYCDNGIEKDTMIDIVKSVD